MESQHRRFIGQARQVKCLTYASQSHRKIRSWNGIAVRRKLYAIAASLTAMSLLITGCGSSDETARSAAPADSSREALGDYSEPVPVLTDEEPSPAPLGTFSRRELGDQSSPVAVAAPAEGELPGILGDSAEVSGPAEVTTPAEVGSSPDATSNAQPRESEQAASEQSVDVKLCVRNDSSRTVTIASGFGESNPRDIAPGGEQCSQNSNLFGTGVMGQIGLDGAAAMAISVSNPLVGLSSVTMSQPGYGQCLKEDLGRKGMKSTTDDGLLRYELERMTPLSPAVQQIEFQLLLSDSSNPSSEPRKCS